MLFQKCLWFIEKKTDKLIDWSMHQYNFDKVQKK